MGVFHLKLREDNGKQADWAGCWNRPAKPHAGPSCSECEVSRETSLVREGRAFYNPSNTALEAVVSFTRYPALNRQSERLRFLRASV
jgi:hypothetical protein